MDNALADVEIDRSENTYPNPNNTNPTTLNRLDISEAPVAVLSDDGGHKLGEAECTEQCN